MDDMADETMYDPDQWRSRLPTCLGAFCVFSAATASSSAFIFVGTKTWTVASSVISYIRRVQAELTRYRGHHSPMVSQFQYHSDMTV